MSSFLKLSRPALIGLAAALNTGRVHSPYSIPNLESLIPKGLCQEIVEELNRLSSLGASPSHIAYTLNLLAAERTTTQQVRDRIFKQVGETTCRNS